MLFLLLFSPLSLFISRSVSRFSRQNVRAFHGNCQKLFAIKYIIHEWIVSSYTYLHKTFATRPRMLNSWKICDFKPLRTTCPRNADWKCQHLQDQQDHKSLLVKSKSRSQGLMKKNEIFLGEKFRRRDFYHVQEIFSRGIGHQKSWKLRIASRAVRHTLQMLTENFSRNVQEK